MPYFLTTLDTQWIDGGGGRGALHLYTVTSDSCAKWVYSKSVFFKLVRSGPEGSALPTSLTHLGRIRRKAPADRFQDLKNSKGLWNEGNLGNQSPNRSTNPASLLVQVFEFSKAYHKRILSDDTVK